MSGFPEGDKQACALRELIVSASRRSALSLSSIKYFLTRPECESDPTSSRKSLGFRHKEFDLHSMN